MRRASCQAAKKSINRSINNRRAKRGPLLKRAFSLIEVLTAVTILSVALLAYVTATTASRNTIDRGNYYALASEAAAAKFADLQGGGYTGFGGHGSTTTYNVSHLPNGVMTVWVTYLDNSGWNSGLPIWEIDISVSWSAGNGQTTQSAAPSIRLPTSRSGADNENAKQNVGW